MPLQQERVHRQKRLGYLLLEFVADVADVADFRSLPETPLDFVEVACRDNPQQSSGNVADCPKHLLRNKAGTPQG